MTIVAVAWLMIWGHSMEPTLRDGRAYPYQPITSDTVTVARGDLVVFQFASRRSEPPLVKRVTGVPGDSLGARHGREVPTWTTWEVIPEGHYYVRSDTPSSRYDSRRFGLISRAQILGRVVP